MRFLGSLLVVVAAALATGGCGEDEAPRPLNVVLVVTDDQGWADLGCYGAEDIATPHLDRLAEEGLLFRSFYVSQSVCSASRASLLTGCYAERVGILGALRPWDVRGLDPAEDTIADLLKARGYATCAVGKWHLGHEEPYLPLQQGFDEYFGLPYSNDMWPLKYDAARGEAGGKSFYPELPLLEGNEATGYVRSLEDQATLTQRYTERAVRFVDEHHDRPFFLYVAHTMPHVPLGVSKPFRESSEQGAYGDVIQEIDDSTGRILAALERHDLVDDTLVVFLSDNGPWLNFGDHAGSAGPFREGKGTCWEGGVRVPCLMRWPGVIEPGRVTDALAASIDVLPTLVAATGAKAPTRPIDGVDLGPLLAGEPGARPRDAFLHYEGGALHAVREGRFKLVFPHRARSYVGVEPGRGGQPGPYAWLEVERALYDLEADPGETTDVQGSHPDAIERLEALAEAARADLGDRKLGVVGAGLRVPEDGADAPPPDVAHLAVGCPVALAFAYTPKYAAGGDGALVDGRLGSLDFHDGRWQGYEAKDVTATVDLGEVREVSEVTCRFLESQVSWIFWPSHVAFATSLDGADFETVAREPVAAPEIRHQPSVRAFTAAFAPKRVRFVRVSAPSQKTCPPWHPGAGGKAWIFVDEITVR